MEPEGLLGVIGAPPVLLGGRKWLGVMVAGGRAGGDGWSRGEDDDVWLVCRVTHHGELTQVSTWARLRVHVRVLVKVTTWTLRQQRDRGHR